MRLENKNRHAQATAYLRLENINRYAQATLYLRLENINRYAHVTSYLRLENRNKYAQGWELVTCSCAMISVSARFEDVRGDRKLLVRQECRCLYCEWGGGVCGRSVRLGHENKAVCIV